MRWSSRWRPYSVLLLALLATAVSTYAFHRGVAQRDRSRLSNNVDTVFDRIDMRLRSYVLLLRSTRALFAADPDVTHEEFREFEQGLEIQERFPGIRSIGFLRRIAPGEVSTVGIGPEPARPERYAITYLEPMDARTQAALGADMFTEPERREAMERARDTGEAAATGRVTLIEGIDDERQPGFLIYVPVYRGGRTPAAVEERRAGLAGFVFGAFRAGDFFEGIFGTERSPRLAFSVHDGATPTPESLLHRTPGAAFEGGMTSVHTMKHAGRTWTITFHTTPAFHAVSARAVTPYFAVAGGLISLLFFLLTTSEARAKDEAQKKSADLHRAVGVRDDFLAVAGHELKTPLAALQLQVDGICRLLERGELAGDPARLETRLGKVRAHVARLELLIHELLDVSRISAGRLALSIEEFELEALVKEVVERFREQATRTGTPIQVSADEAVVGRWDRMRVDQVVTNIVSNALKYGAGKSVEVRVGVADDVARLEVRDHGIGIEPGDSERIFGRFERAVSQRNYGGFGLGLWISRQIVEAHGGHIRFESDPGMGSTFTVELPRERA
jgi:signal transduction histidine kinase